MLVTPSLSLAMRRLKRLPSTALSRRRNTKPDALIDRSVQILGWDSVSIGHHVIISEGCWLNVNCKSDDTPRIRIGGHSLIGRRNTISSGALISLGEYTLTGPDCSIIGSDHRYDDPMRPYISTGNTCSAIIVVEPNCWLGAGVTVLGDVTIGRGSIIGAKSVVTKSIPPFSIAVGNPARVLKRFDAIARRWVAAAVFTQAMEEALPSTEEYLNALRDAGRDLVLPGLASGYRAGDTR